MTFFKNQNGFKKQNSFNELDLWCKQEGSKIQPQLCKKLSEVPSAMLLSLKWFMDVYFWHRERKSAIVDPIFDF